MLGIAVGQCHGMALAMQPGCQMDSQGRFADAPFGVCYDDDAHGQDVTRFVAGWQEICAEGWLVGAAAARQASSLIGNHSSKQADMSACSDNNKPTISATTLQTTWKVNKLIDVHASKFTGKLSSPMCATRSLWSHMGKPNDESVLSMIAMLSKKCNNCSCHILQIFTYNN